MHRQVDFHCFQWMFVSFSLPFVLEEKVLFDSIDGKV